MARSPERQGVSEPATEDATSAMEPPKATKSERLPSPTRSDKSSDSEGKPVREKLKETRIDTQASTSNEVPTNGAHGDHNTSGSESERGRLRRKRSREDFEDDHDDSKHPEKKHERHVRKKSRDVTSPVGSDIDISIKKTASSVPPISEHIGDESMQSVEGTTQEAPPRPTTPDAIISDKEAAVTSPNNKRSREQAESVHAAVERSQDSTATSKVDDERDTKRPRDRVESEPIEKTTISTTKIPPGSAFLNSSAISPFASMSPKPTTAKTTDKSGEDAPQTSNEAFTKSGFGSFASSTASPFSLAKSSASSAFAAPTGNKLASFASSPAPSATNSSGFASLGSSTGQSAFGSSASTTSAFGGTLAGKGFGGLGAATKLTSFGSGSGITGLTKKADKPFGAKEEIKESESEDEDEDGEDGQGNEEDEQAEERRASQTLLQAQGPLETGEENEDAIWNGRAKLYTFAGTGKEKTWHERGMGPFKVNVSRDPPTKARLILRADGTHRLLLNAAVTKNMSFGDAKGGKPEDGRLLFTSPTSTGDVEQHLIKLRSEKAIELWQVINDLKDAI